MLIAIPALALRRLRPLCRALAAVLVLAGTRAGFQLAGPYPLGPAAFEPEEVFPVDLDGDGDQDVLVASIADQRLSWFENEGGVLGSQHAVADGVPEAYTVLAADLDADGDADVLSTRSGSAVWYENKDGLGSFGPQHVIGAGGDVFAADLDGDGDQDVLSTSYADDSVAWHENTDGLGAFGPGQVISDQVDGAARVLAADIDGDGDEDVLSAAQEGHTIAWHENADGVGGFAPPQILDSAFSGVLSVSAGDLDADGDVDVPAGSIGGWDHPDIVWYENEDASGTFSPPQLVSSGYTYGGLTSISTADIDGDGAADLLASTSGRFAGASWYSDPDGVGTFTYEDKIAFAAGTCTTARAADFDGDADMDVVLADSYHHVTWHENEDLADLWPAHPMTLPSAQRPTDLDTADFDGDGDLDVLRTGESFSGFESSVAWYENENGTSTFGTIHSVTHQVEESWGTAAADLDGDGDPDVLSASAKDRKLAWYENMDGRGSFGPQQIIQIGPHEPLPVVASDLDLDGDQDVLYGSREEAAIGWFANDGLGTFGPEVTIMSDPGASKSVSSLVAADLDGDGDADILAARNADGASWYENGGAGGFGLEQAVTGLAVPTVRVDDLDGDGDLDVAFNTSWPSTHTVAWSSNDGSGSFGPHTVIDELEGNFHAITTVDSDRDGDRDVAAGNYHGLNWYPNLDGLATFGAPIAFPSDFFFFIGGPRDMLPADLDNDGDEDLLLAEAYEDVVLAYESLSCPPAAPAAEIVRLGSPSNPDAFLPGATSGPVIGHVWDPRLEHGTFLPAAVIDFVAVSTGALNLPTSFGTLLCDLTAPSLVAANATPGTPFDIAIPDTCELVGLALSAQGASIDGSGTLKLANALDLTLGSY
jgi:hypothetical protein